MSDLLRQLATYIRSADDPQLHVITGQDWTDEESTLPDARPQTAAARLIEGDRLSVRCVGDPTAGRLAYFEDGIERKHIPLYCTMVPVVYGYVAAAIRRRGQDRRMRAHDCLREESLFFPFDLLDPQAIRGAGLSVTDTAVEGEPLQEHPVALKEAARVAIGKARGRLEARLARRWLQEHDTGDDWLVVDGSLGGTLGGDYQRYASPCIVGIIKSHSTQYFALDEQRLILELRAGERSSVFQPLGREQRAPVYSWYLRLRPNEGQDLYFGLVRIEAAAGERTVELADELSRWILAERCPLSLPDPRWDRMIYPIKDCEQYLRSLAPSRAAMEAPLLSVGGRRS